MIKGKILFTITLLIALVFTAAGALGGYGYGIALEQQFGTTFVAYDWNLIKIVITAACAVIAFFPWLPMLIVSRQVCRMYNVSRKYAKWSVGTTLFTLLLVAIAGGGTAYVCYLLNSVPAASYMLLEQMIQQAFGVAITLDALTLQIASGVTICSVMLLIFLPLVISLRMRDSVSAMLKKKRAYSEDEE